VDCTADSGKKLCEKYGVEGYPTLMYFNPPDTEPEKYEGGRSLKELKKFVKTLGPACTADTWENCSKKQKEELQPYLDIPAEELAKSLADYQTQLKETQTAHDTLMESLQSQYKASDEKLKALKDELAPKIKLMKAATKKPAATETKEEM